jgi:circadian clock protein KaiC
LQGVASLANAVLVMLTHQARDVGSPEHTMVDGWIEISNDTIDYRAVQSIQVRKHRGAQILGGKHRIRISANGLEVYPRLESCIGDVPPRPHPGTSISTGLPGFDRLLGGGLPSESATLILGPTGSGKTTMGMYFVAQATEQAPALMLSFYESPTRLRARARQLGFDLDHLADQNVLRLLWLSPAELIVDEVVHGVVLHAKAIGAKRVFIDGIVVLRDSLVHRERLPYLINALSMQLRECGATVVYTQESMEMEIDRTMPNDELSAMVDNVVVLNISRRHHTQQRYISIVKMRDRHFDPRVQPFHMGEQGLALGVDPKASGFDQAD